MSWLPISSIGVLSVMFNTMHRKKFPQVEPLLPYIQEIFDTYQFQDRTQYTFLFSSMVLLYTALSITSKVSRSSVRTYHYVYWDPSSSLTVQFVWKASPVLNKKEILRLKSYEAYLSNALSVCDSEFLPAFVQAKDFATV